jgi:hypothetical protein
VREALLFEPAELFFAAVVRVPPDPLRDAVRALAVRAAPERCPPLDEPDEAAELSSPVQLPDMARWTASVTASAINEPSLVALVITALAACDALSAASRPASRMARRAFGLALMAAAAAARPAASISRLIAAFAILSTVLSEPLLEPDEDFPDLLDFAIANLPCRLLPKTLQRRNGSVRRDNAGFADMLKGTAAFAQRCPSTWSAAEGDGRSLSTQGLRTPLSDLPAEP